MEIPNVQIYPLAVSKIIKHSILSPNKEIAGFLIGYVNNENKLIITDALQGRQYGNSVHVIIEDIELAKAAEKLESFGLEEQIVGWYHSHPNMGAHFFSMTDVATQNRYQMFLPQAVGFVIDTSKFQRSSDLNNLDLKCWKVIGNQAINIEYNIITDPTECLNNILSHSINYPPYIHEISPLISMLISQIGGALEKVEYVPNIIKKVGASMTINGTYSNKILIQTLILGMFILFTVLFLIKL
ncbi:MAG: Mov34/MPN/PAD-1 family protein [Candidatus Helarchaeota archaeon]